LRFLDANVFIRLISGDDQAKMRACLALFQRLRAGDEEGTASEAVLAEIVYVLGSARQYGMSRDAIAGGLGNLLSIDGLRVPGRNNYLRALDLFAANRLLDFEDALTVAHMESRGIKELYSYDRGFDSVPGITRIEP
jgi:uncharacterized protein